MDAAADPGSRTPCRLLNEIDLEVDSKSAARGAWNMAVDEVLLGTASESQVSTLRLYSWQPTTVSLGYFQKHEDRKEHAASLDCELVRRASGGGAIVHDQELTYSFALPSENRFGVEQLYYGFHETLVETLAQFGVTAVLHTSEEGLRSDAFLCFQRRAAGDVVVDGHKIAGSAQRRSQGGLLQHGSLMLAQSVHAPELPGIRELAGIEISPAEFVRVWLPRLTSELNIHLQPDHLTDKENAAVDNLVSQRFANADWTLRR